MPIDWKTLDFSRETKAGRRPFASGDRTVRKVGSNGCAPCASVSVGSLGVEKGDYVLVIYEEGRIILMRGKAPDHTPAVISLTPQPPAI